MYRSIRWVIRYSWIDAKQSQVGFYGNESRFQVDEPSFNICEATTNLMQHWLITDTILHLNFPPFCHFLSSQSQLYDIFSRFVNIWLKQSSCPTLWLIIIIIIIIIAVVNNLSVLFPQLRWQQPESRNLFLVLSILPYPSSWQCSRQSCVPWCVKLLSLTAWLSLLLHARTLTESKLGSYRLMCALAYLALEVSVRACFILRLIARDYM